MKKNHKLLIFSITTSLVLNGCTLNQHSKYEEIQIKIEQTTIGQDSVLETTLKTPKTEEEKNQLIEYIKTLKSDTQILIYLKEERDPYCEEIFTQALKENPKIQFYYCGKNNIASIYPNVTYVPKEENLEQTILKNYQRNQVCGSLIQLFRDTCQKTMEFDLEESILSIQKNLNLDSTTVLEGLTLFLEYIEQTELFQKCEEVSDSVSEALKPYMEALIPKIKSILHSTKPYLKKGIQKTKEVYEEVKPNIKNVYQKVKTKLDHSLKNYDIIK